MKKIAFNIPFIAGNEDQFLSDVMHRKHLAGKGYYSKQCLDWFSTRFGFERSFLTPSCSDALEMCALLLHLKEGDEVVVPSYAFVTTANAFGMHGARIVYADSKSDSPNLNVQSVEASITSKTKAIVALHYGGVPCDVIALRQIADKHDILLIEDAACALGSTIDGKAIGTIGDLATFSFHETKNISSGKGGLLVVNKKTLYERASIIWEKGTNRSAFFRGEVDKYGWVDFGSSYLMSEVTASFLYAQLQRFDEVQEKRQALWTKYHASFSEIKLAKNKKHNAHCFYLLLSSEKERAELISFLTEHGIKAVFHYQALHLSSFSKEQFGEYDLPNATKFDQCLLRLPLHFSLEESDVDYVIKHIQQWQQKSSSSLEISHLSN